MTKLSATEQYAYRLARRVATAFNGRAPKMTPRHTRTFLRNWRKGAHVTSRYTIAAK